MAKAITEVAIGAAAIGASFIVPGAGIAFLGLSHAAAVSMLTSIGASEIMSGFAAALRKNQAGLAVAVTTPVGPWGYIYGRQKVGGVEIFRQSNDQTGVAGATTSAWKQLHRVYALACHSCQIGDDWQLRIDGRQVLMQQDPAAPTSYKSYTPTQVVANIYHIQRDANGLVTVKIDRPIYDLDGLPVRIAGVSDATFNGFPIVTQPNPGDATLFQYVSGGAVSSVDSSGTFTTAYSDYQDKIRVEFLDGHHTETFQVLRNAGTSWGLSDKCLGRTLAYVQMGYDESVFPSSIPNVSFVINGKDDILDPRSGSRGYTTNAVLCIADFMAMPRAQGGFGLTIGVRQPLDRIIAGANVCDEPVQLAVGGTIARYQCNTFFQLNETRGTILANLLTSCAGRIVRQQGQRFVIPGVWQAPTLELDDNDLIGPIDWHARLSIRDTCNAVKGTYVSPENAYQSADAPPYMQNYERGFGALADPGQGDRWLVEDRLERIFDEYNFPCTDNAATVQRLEKIALMRKRHQGRGTIRVSMKAFRVVAGDVILLHHPRFNTPGTSDWDPRTLEVTAKRVIVDKSGDGPRLGVELDVADTGADIFDWSTAEELTPAGYKQTYTPASL